MGFKKATKKQAKARIALNGPSGAGKTYTALTLATELGQNVAVIDTERGSASKYADEFEFDVMELGSFHPQNFIDGIQEAEVAGYDVLVIDSLSHAWMGKDGALELVDKAATRSQSKNSYFAWREVTPLHNALVDAMLQSKMHIIVTMRSKTEYIVETDGKGKQVPRKIGMAPIQRDGMEYEFDIVGDLDLDNNFIVSKSRCRALGGAVISKPGKDTADIIKAWLGDGEEPFDEMRLKNIMSTALEKGIKTKSQWAQFLQDAVSKSREDLTNEDLDVLTSALAEIAVTDEQEAAN